MGINCHKAFRIIFFVVCILWLTFCDAALKAPVNFLSMLWLIKFITTKIIIVHHLAPPITYCFLNGTSLVATTGCHSHFHYLSHWEEEGTGQVASACNRHSCYMWWKSNTIQVLVVIVVIYNHGSPQHVWASTEHCPGQQDSQKPAPISLLRCQFLFQLKIDFAAQSNHWWTNN